MLSVDDAAQSFHAWSTFHILCLHIFVSHTVCYNFLSLLRTGFRVSDVVLIDPIDKSATHWFQVDLDFSKTRIVASRSSSLSRQHLVTTISCPYIYTGCCLCPAAQARSQPRLLPERVRIHFLLLWSCNVVCMSMCACRQLALECE
jgi:hypothetical protein